MFYYLQNKSSNYFYIVIFLRYIPSLISNTFELADIIVLGLHRFLKFRKLWVKLRFTTFKYSKYKITFLFTSSNRTCTRKWSSVRAKSPNNKQSVYSIYLFKPYRVPYIITITITRSNRKRP